MHQTMLRGGTTRGKHSCAWCVHRSLSCEGGVWPLNMHAGVKEEVYHFRVPATFEKRDSSKALVMVLVTEGGLAEEP